MTAILHIGYQSTNYYLLDSGKTRLLIDAGWPDTWQKFLHVLRTKDVDLQKIGYVFVTHFHPDHAGLVPELRGSGVKLIACEEQHTTADIILPAGKSRPFLKTLGFDGELIPTPGHSDDSITLVLDTGEAFTGDLTPLPAAPLGDIVLQNSWQRLHTAGTTRIYPGHGPYAIPIVTL